MRGEGGKRGTNLTLEGRHSRLVKDMAGNVGKWRVHRAWVEEVRCASDTCENSSHSSTILPYYMYTLRHSRCASSRNVVRERLEICV